MNPCSQMDCVFFSLAVDSGNSWDIHYRIVLEHIISIFWMNCALYAGVNYRLKDSIDSVYRFN